LKLGLAAGVGKQLSLLEEKVMPELHELPDNELREKLASGELGDKKAVTARAVLRRRRRERIQVWLKKHAWLGTILAAIGLAGIFAVSQRDATE
jgi:hypothetical protein